LWEAAVAAGATLDELARLDQYPVQFQALLVAWHQKHMLVELHTADAVNRAADRRAKRKK